MNKRLLILIVLALTAVTASAATHIVHPGESIAAKLTLAVPGDVVEIMPGRYEEHDLALPGGIQFRGYSEDAGAVVIDALGQGRVLMIDNQAGPLAVRNLTLTGGVADLGGGALCSGDEVSFKNVVFSQNSAAYGGGLLVRDVASCIVQDCLFVDNASATSGGGLHCVGLGSETSELLVVGSLFALNEAGASGGGLSVSWGGRVELSACTLAANDAPAGAGLSAWDVEAVVAEGTLIADNLDAAVSADAAGLPVFACSDLYGNAGGDWTGGLAGQLGVDGNVSEDPLFCGVNGAESPWSVDAASPCAPGNTPGCEGIGALGVGCEGTTAIEPDLPDPDDVVVSATRLHPARPNPFNPSTQIRFDLHAPGRASLEVFDARGHRVAVLHQGDLGVGTHVFEWHGRDASGRAVSTGVYFARLRTATHLETRRLALIK